MENSNRLIQRTLITFSVTYIVVNLASNSAYLIDEIVVARLLGSAEMAAVGLASPCFAILALIPAVFSVGVQQHCASALSVGEQEKAGQIFSDIVTVMIVISILITILAFAFSDYLCILFGVSREDTEMFRLLNEYLKGNFFGIPMNMIFLLLSPLVVLDGNKKCITVATVIQNTVNIAFDWISVEVFHLGIFGIGLATSLGWVAGLLALLTNYLREKTLFRFRLQRIKLNTIKEVVYLGSPQMGKYAGKFAARVCMNWLVIYFGGFVCASAMSINQGLNGFLLSIGLGISECVKLCIQTIYNMRDRRYLKQLTRCALRIMLISTGVLAILVAVFAKPIAMFFVKDDPVLLSMSTIAIACLGISLPFNAVNSSIISYLQASEKIRLTTFMHSAHRFFGIVIMTAIMGFIVGPVGIFIAIPLCEIVILAYYLIYSFITCRNEKTALDKVLLFSESFDDTIAGVMTLSVTSMEDVVTVSRNVDLFLRESGCESKKKIYVAALALEEMAGNIVSHGFVLDDANHNCDISIVLEKNQRICLHIRDDCPLFDVRKQFEAMRSDSIEKNIGIKMIFTLAQDAKYVNLLNLNTLIIKI